MFVVVCAMCPAFLSGKLSAKSAKLIDLKHGNKSSLPPFLPPKVWRVLAGAVLERNARTLGKSGSAAAKLCPMLSRVRNRSLRARTDCSGCNTKVALMLCLIESTGVLEQNLAVFRNFAKHGFSNSNLGNCCKLRFDSSPVGQYIGQEYRVTPFGARCWRVTPRSMEGS